MKIVVVKVAPKVVGNTCDLVGNVKGNVRRSDLLLRKRDDLDGLIVHVDVD